MHSRCTIARQPIVGLFVHLEIGRDMNVNTHTKGDEMPVTINGSEMCQRLQQEAKAQFVHRYTGEHKPAWVKGPETPVQFKDDMDWLANTWFWVAKKGELANRPGYCVSHPTWPLNPELRKGNKK